jgi:anti-sigma regulatory factor (Ser/Thr protein kinase)
MDQRPVVDNEASHSSAGRRTAPQHHARRRPTPSDCDIRLTMPARAENVALVRHVIGALADALGLPTTMVEDVKLAVTEACTNVVRHAYSGTDGPLDVKIEPADGTLTVVVSDHGRGIRPDPSSGGAGLGLPLIAALANELEIEEGQQRGSRVRMSFEAGDRLRSA